MPLPEPLYTIAAPVIQYFDLPVKSTEILVELTLLAGSILLSVLGHIIIKHICAHHSRLPEYLPRLIALSLMAFTCWGTSTWLHQHEVNAPFISSIGVFVTLWIVFRITNRFKIPQTPRRILLATIASMGLLATGNYLRPLLDFLAEIKLPLGESNLSLLMIIQAIAIFMVFSWASFASATWMEKSMERNKMSPALITLLIKIFKTVALIFALLVTLNLMGINLSSLTIFGGALGIGIGFGLKTVTSNFISGILLLLDKSIKPGDVISIDDMTFGQVKAMNTRYIVMRRRDGMEALIPNETLMVNQVINWSYSNRAIRQEVDIRVSYDSDMEQVREILLTAVKTVNRVLEVPPPVCFIREFADSSVVFLLRYWSNDPENGVNNLKGAVNMAAWKALKEAGVKIPYPQHVLHMAEDNPPKRKKQWRRKPKISSDIG